jgi:hypothetical protein
MINNHNVTKHYISPLHANGMDHNFILTDNSDKYCNSYEHKMQNNKISWGGGDFVALAHKRTKPTERPLLVCEVSANFCG